MFIFITFCFVLLELMYIVDTKNMVQKNLKMFELSKEFKGKPSSEYSDEYKNGIFGILARFIIVFGFVFGGLVTEQWELFVGLIGINFIVVGPLNKLFKKVDAMNMYYIVTWVNSVIGFVAGVFYLVNYYHLKLDLTEIVQNFF